MLITSDSLKAKAVELAAEIDQKLTAAPADGKAYIQKDGQWQEIDILGVPVGTLAYWPLPAPPAGWLEGNGQSINHSP